jgi:hypothetical protein
MEDAMIAQTTAGELRQESILRSTLHARLKPFGETGLIGLRVWTKERLGAYDVASDVSSALMPYSLACSLVKTRVTPNSSVWYSCPLTVIADRWY